MRKKKSVVLSLQLREVIRQVNTRTDAVIQQVNKNTDEKIETAIAQMVQAVEKSLENHPTKDDHNRLEGKVNELDHKVGNLVSDVSDIRRRVIDLEHDAPAQVDFDSLKKRVERLESAS